MRETPHVSVDIQQLSGGDWARWRELRLRALADAPEAFRATLEEELGWTDDAWKEIVEATAAHDRGNAWIAEFDSVDVGMTFATVDASHTSLLIGAMWVSREARGGGIGKALLDSAIEWGAAMGASVAELWVTEANDVARALYESHGFIQTDETDLLRPGSDLVVRKLTRTIEGVN